MYIPQTQTSVLHLAPGASTDVGAQSGKEQQGHAAQITQLID
jgi:hypothetical protein